MYIKEKEICAAYISKLNLNCEKKKLSTLLRGITLKHHGDLSCLNSLHFFRKENKLKSYEKCVKINIFVKL